MSGKRRIGVSGARGRMGEALCGLVRESDRATLAARFDAPGAADDGQTPSLGALERDLAACDVVVDVSGPAGTAALIDAALRRGAPALVLGATGLSPDEESAVSQAAGRLAIVRSANFSLGVNLLAALVRQAAERLGAQDWDIEIVEAHHRRKVDAPSGAALMLGAAASRGLGGADRLPARDGVTGARPVGPIGYASIRGGGIVGEHSVVFAAEDEVLTLSHSARDRRLFARGALAAALWVADQAPGLYGMDDVLGL